jgi:hypothetical protein
MPAGIYKSDKKDNRFLLVLIVISIVIGAFYTLAPHSVHMKYSPDWIIGFNFPHSYHVLYGIVAFGYALFLVRML